MNLERKKILEIITIVAAKYQVECSLVGGYLRDQLQGLESDDLDFSISDCLVDFVQEIAKILDSSFNGYSEFLTASIKLNSLWQTKTKLPNLDFCQFRQEVYPFSGSLPKIIAGTFQQDLERRDFSINTLTIPVSEYLSCCNDDFVVCNLRSKIHDPLGGLLDLDSKLIRILHSKSFEDDPTRIFRAARYKVLIDGVYHAETESRLHQAIAEKALSKIDRYRIANELTWIAKSSRAKDIFVELEHVGVFAEILGQEQAPDGFLRDKIDQIELIGDTEENLCILLGVVALAYQETNNLECFGLKNRLNNKIRKMIS